MISKPKHSLSVSLDSLVKSNSLVKTSYYAYFTTEWKILQKSLHYSIVQLQIRFGSNALRSKSIIIFRKPPYRCRSPLDAFLCSLRKFCARKTSEHIRVYEVSVSEKVVVFRRRLRKVHGLKRIFQRELITSDMQNDTRIYIYESRSVTLARLFLQDWNLF